MTAKYAAILWMVVTTTTISAQAQEASPPQPDAQGVEEPTPSGQLPAVEVITETPPSAKPAAPKKQVKKQPSPPSAQVPPAVPADAASAGAGDGAQALDTAFGSFNTGGSQGRSSGYNAENAFSATKTDTPVFETPQAVTVVPRDLLDDRKPVDTNEALLTVPGFVPASDYIFDQAYVLRGFVVNGDSLYQKTRDGRQFPSVIPTDPDLLERIEVIRGPASVLYGQLEPGGLINYVSKRATLYYDGGYVEQRFGNFNQYKTIVDLNVSSGNVAARLPGVYATGESFRDEVDFENYEVAPAFTWQLSPDTRVSLLSTLGKRDRTDDSIARPVVNNQILDVPRSRFLGEPSYRNEIEFGTIAAEVEHRIVPGVTVRSSYTYFDVQRDIDYALNFSFFPPAAPNSLARAGGTDNSTQSGHLFQADVLSEALVLGMKHKFVVGFDALIADRDATIVIGSLSDIDINSPVYNPAVSPLPPFLGFDYYFDYVSRIESKQYGLYLQDEVTLVEDAPGIHKLTLLLGGRFDWSNQDFDPSGTIFGTPQVQATLDNSAFSPRAALLWMPNPWLSLYTSYSESFNPRDPETLGLFLVPNPDPSLAEQYEIGAKIQLSHHLYASVAAYDITKTNVESPDPITGFTILTGEVRSRGVEFEVNGEILPGWQIAGAYSINDAVVTEDTSGNVGNRLFGSAEHVLGVWTGYTMPRDTMLPGFGFGAGLTYVGEVFYDNTNTLELPAYTLFDAAIWYKPDKGSAPYAVEYQLSLKNITDEEYFIAGNGLFTVTDGAPRTVFGSVKLKY